VNVYLYPGAVDMRKQINGLVAIVEEELSSGGPSQWTVPVRLTTNINGPASIAITPDGRYALVGNRNSYVASGVVIEFQPPAA
jgi:hypothetical protein